MLDRLEIWVRPNDTRPKCSCQQIFSEDRRTSSNLVFLRAFLIENLIRLGAAVIPAMQRAGFTIALQHIKIGILKDHRLHIWCALISYTVAAEKIIAGSEDCRLGVMYLPLIGHGRIAGASRYCHVNLIFHAPGLRAITHAHISRSLIRLERHKHYVRAFAGRNATQLRKFNVITY